MEKVTVSKEVAKAIDDARERFTDAEIVSAANGWNTYDEDSLVFLRRWCNGDKTTGREGLLMRALVIGYQVEMSPEEKLRLYHAEAAHHLDEVSGSDYGGACHYEGVLTGIEKALDILGITIEGINEEETE